MKMTRLDVLGMLVVVAGLAGACCVGGAQAQTQVCGPGKDCVSRTFQTPTVPRARFAPCNRARVGQLAFDGDAGAYRVCNFDGGWGLVADTNGGGDSRWSWDGQFMSFNDDDAGTGSIRRANDYSATVSFAPTGVNLFGAEQIVMTTVNQQLELNDVTGLVLNGQAPIYAMPESTYWYDGGTISPNDTYAQTVTFSGAELHDICVIEQPPPTQGDGYLSLTCTVTAAETLQLYWFNRLPTDNIDARCSFANVDCGRRVRLIQRR